MVIIQQILDCKLVRVRGFRQGAENCPVRADETWLGRTFKDCSVMSRTTCLCGATSSWEVLISINISVIQGELVFRKHSLIVLQPNCAMSGVPEGVQTPSLGSLGEPQCLHFSHIPSL